MLSRVEFILSASLFIMAIFSPRLYSYSYILWAFVITIVGIGLFFRSWGRSNENFLQFEPIFAVVALIMGFTFPLFVYPYNEDAAYMFSWGIPYSLNYFNKGACLTGMGILAFLSGSSTRNQLSSKYVKSVSSTRVISSKKLSFWLFIILLCYMLLGGFERYRTIYVEGEDGGSFLTYIEVFIIALSQVIIANEVWNTLHRVEYKIDKSSLLIVVFISLYFMYVGNRTYSLYLLMPLTIFLTTYKYKVNFKAFVVLIALGVGAMVFIMLFRSRAEFNQELGWYYYLVDLMIPNTTTYLGCEVVDERGFSYGSSLLGSILGAIPFSQSLLSILTGIGSETTNSSTIFTVYLGSKTGTGTNFVADSYLAFGSLGVFFISYYGGRFLNLVKNRSQYSYYYLVVYVVYCGFAVYMVRASFLYPIRFIVYSLLFAFINSNLRKKCS